jgi:mannose-6-phosphate isomerase
LKAALIRWWRTGAPSEVDEAAAAFSGLEKYLDNPSPNLWRDKLLPDGTWLDEPTPASSFYHIVCSMSELIRSSEAAGASNEYETE